MSTLREPDYLSPYFRAVRQHGAEISALLWASETTQAARFDAFTRLCDFEGKTVLDVGCGRADFLDHLLGRGIRPSHYVGIEAVAEFAEAAERKRHHDCIILRADFVAEPVKMFVGAEIVVFSGSLNTLDRPAAVRTIRTAYQASAGEMCFNFLASPSLAAATYLTWHEPAVMLELAGDLCPNVASLDDYLSGDFTIALTKPEDRSTFDTSAADKTGAK